MDLTGRGAVVTGAASGIGRALTAALAARGARVIAADVEREALHEAVQRLDGVVPVVTDVADTDSVDALAKRAWDETGDVALVAANAGVFQGGLLWERTTEDWAWVLGVNLWGAIHLVRAFVPRMLDAGRPGHVVVTSSMAGLATGAMAGPYQTSKFAVRALAESLHHDLRSQGAAIGVSLVCPGPVATSIGTSTRNRPASLARGVEAADAGFVDEMLRDTTGRGRHPDEVAAIVLRAVDEGTFYVMTEDRYDAHFREVCDDLLTRRPPTPVTFA